MEGIRYKSELEYKLDVDREVAIAIRRKEVMRRVADRIADLVRFTRHLSCETPITLTGYRVCVAYFELF